MDLGSIEKLMTTLRPSDAPVRMTSPEEFNVIRNLFKDYHINDQITKVNINADNMVLPVFCAKTVEKGFIYKTNLFPSQEFRSFMELTLYTSQHIKEII